MSIGIKAIASYIPENFVDNVAQAEKFSESPEFIKNKIGAIKLPRKDQKEETSDLAVQAVKNLLDQTPEISISDIEALVVITQNPDGSGLPHTSAIVQNKLALPQNVAAFDVSLGCSGYVYGLYLMKGFMEASGLKNGILVTADPYSKVVDPEDKITSLLFGDAATATLLSEAPVWQLGEVLYGTNGAGCDYLKVDHGTLKMNGRQVFNFALSSVAPHIRDLLEISQMELVDVDLFCLHQGSAAIVNAIANQFAPVEHRFINDIQNTGNTISSSIPLLLEKYAFNSPLKTILVSGFGVGMSWASAILKKND